MNTDTLEGDWKQLKGEVQKQWGKLTGEPLDEINGNREKLAGAIQKSYGIARDEADKQVSAWEEASKKARKSA
jgi:uncharacterized protein YjbJ (UPF0337 family)